jgi:hypothetical protein
MGASTADPAHNFFLTSPLKKSRLQTAPAPNHVRESPLTTPFGSDKHQIDSSLLYSPKYVESVDHHINS